MLNIKIESSFLIPANCVGRNIPRVDGNFYLFAVSDEEYMFWQGLAPAEQQQFADSMTGRCFVDALVKLMRKKRPMNYLESTATGIDENQKVV
ncbi:MAG: hypothetical protein JRN15_04225 [Nitrososphaerota archaeon]|nr:hypothetical protein [Nitrososphaerota archaeon]